jgi:tRNA (mo5U34)-methyltransferase
MTAKTELSAAEKVDLQHLVNQHYWWHSIELSPGIVTPGKKKLENMKKEFELVFSGISFEGKTVLDVGAWNGGFAVEAARRGARRVVAVDHSTWNSPKLKGRATFDLVAEVTGLPLEAVDIDLDTPRLSLAHLGKFDVILYLGVFYHLKDPIAVTREIAALVQEVLIGESHVELTEEQRPNLIFYPGRELGNNESNWWGPNPALLEALLTVLGFQSIILTEGINPHRRIFHASDMRPPRRRAWKGW